MTPRFYRLREQMGTFEGRYKVAKELLTLRHTQKLSPGEASLLDQCQNWGRYMDELKNTVRSTKNMLNKIENHVYGNVVEFRKRK